MIFQALFFAVVIWVLQGGVEWKIVRSNEWAAKNFHGWKAMVISGIISFGMAGVVGSTMSPVFGASFILAGIAGMFTNEATFNMWESLHKANNWRKNLTGKGDSAASQTIANAKSDFMVGLKGIGKFAAFLIVMVGKFIKTIGWIASLPSRLQDRKQYAS